MKTKKGRKAPNDSATEFKVGFKKKGNDGNMWQVMKTAKGVKRWIKDDKKRAECEYKSARLAMTMILNSDSFKKIEDLVLKVKNFDIKEVKF